MARAAQKILSPKRYLLSPVVPLFELLPESLLLLEVLESLAAGWLDVPELSELLDPDDTPDFPFPPLLSLLAETLSEPPSDFAESDCAEPEEPGVLLRA